MRPPRCEHGYLLLGCPKDVCPEQDEYVGRVADQMSEWYRQQMGPFTVSTDGSAVRLAE